MNFWKQKHMPWYRIELTRGVEESVVNEANNDAGTHGSGILPSLRYTESRPEWVLLYKHVKIGQIQPEDIRYMYRIDLEYIAGMTSTPPDLTETESAKLRENVARASVELQRRNTVRTALISALVGALIGAVATIATGIIKNSPWVHF